MNISNKRRGPYAYDWEEKVLTTKEGSGFLHLNNLCWSFRNWFYSIFKKVRTGKYTLDLLARNNWETLSFKRFSSGRLKRSPSVTSREVRKQEQLCLQWTWLSRVVEQRPERHLLPPPSSSQPLHSLGMKWGTFSSPEVAYPSLHLNVLPILSPLHILFIPQDPDWVTIPWDVFPLYCTPQWTLINRWMFCVCVTFIS